MKKRIVSIPYGGTFYISQEFNGDRKEAQTLQFFPMIPFWEDVAALFKGVQSVRAFEIALEKAEELYRYKHVPLKEQSVLPKTEEVWQMMDSELELYSRYGKLVF